MFKRICCAVVMLLMSSLSNAETHNYNIDDLLVVKNINTITYLTYTLYHESRGEPDLANMMILSVIWNRMENKHFPNTLEGVVKQDWQFSYLFDKKSDVIKDKVSYKRLHNLVEVFLLNRELFLGLSKGANHYHTVSISPYWSNSKRMKVVGVFGNHIFYKRLD